MRINKSLNQIVEIIAGYTFRGAIEKDPNGAVFVLQAKDIREDLFLDDAKLIKTTIATSHTKAFVQTGDVVISSRGFFRAAVFKTDQTVLAASSIYLLRIKNSAVLLPEYLAIYLNSVAGQRNLSQFLTTGTIRSLLKKDLEKISVPVPSIEKQKQIIRLDENVRQQALLVNRKVTAQKNVLNGILNQLERSPS